MTMTVTSEKGNYVVTDNARGVALRKLSGRPLEGYVYRFTFAGVDIDIYVDQQRGGRWEVKQFQSFPEELKAHRREIVECAKEAFDALFEFMSEKSNATQQVTYSIT